ncbi:MAG: thioredoxin family protein [Breznakia sp.]
MVFFRKKKAENEKKHCGIGGAHTKKIGDKKHQQKVEIKILGSGCMKCNELEKITKIALLELKMSAEIEHISDFSQIAAYGVMKTPALVIDGRVVSYQKRLKIQDITDILRKERG